MKTVLALCLSGFLVGCVSDAEMESYYRAQCQFDRITFKNIKPGSAEFEYCLELHRSGLDGDIHGGEGLGQFND